MGRSTSRISDGYSDQQSYRPGDRVTLFLNARFPFLNTRFPRVRLYDYGGRIVYHEFVADLFAQQAVGPEPWETGFGYRESATFTLPRLRSGVYLVEGIVPLIVKYTPPGELPSKKADIVILYPTNTVAAYNAAGGRSMYSRPTPAPIVSFKRPVGDEAAAVGYRPAPNQRSSHSSAAACASGAKEWPRPWFRNARRSRAAWRS